MIWQDVVVERPLDDREIAEGLAEAFGIGLDQIAVVRDQNDFPDRHEATILCLASTRRSGFRLLLTIFTYLEGSQPESVRVLEQIARSCQTKILISDDSTNPYTMVQIRPSGESVGVNLDVKRLDEEAEYHVASPRD